MLQKTIEMIHQNKNKMSITKTKTKTIVQRGKENIRFDCEVLELIRFGFPALEQCVKQKNAKSSRKKKRESLNVEECILIKVVHQCGTHTMFRGSNLTTLLSSF